MGATFGLAFCISHFLFCFVQAPTNSKGQLSDEELAIISSRICHFSCVTIYRLVMCSILLMFTWPSFLRYVIICNKDNHSRHTLIKNGRKFMDVNRCINLYIGKLYYVQNMYGVR
jgi:hypothetical protein